MPEFYEEGFSLNELEIKKYAVQTVFRPGLLQLSKTAVQSRTFHLIT